MATATTPPVRVRQRPRRQLELAAPEGHVKATRASYGQTIETTEAIYVKPFEVDPARVRVTGGCTKNMGDFNSARVDVMVELPCYPEPTEIARAYEFASQLVDAFIQRETMLATDPNATAATLPPIPFLPVRQT